MDAVAARAALGVSAGASYDELRRAYFDGLRRAHPDTGSGNLKALGQVRAAFRTLAPAAPRDTAASEDQTVHHVDCYA